MSVGISSIRRGHVTVFADDDSFELSLDYDRMFIEEVRDDETLPRLAWHFVDNSFLLKSPLNIVLVVHKPERDFVKRLIKPEIAQKLTAWIISSDKDFYPIEYSWRKGKHPKRNSKLLFIKLECGIFVSMIYDTLQLH